MLITYIHHSCFSVELDDTILLFDYYKGILPTFNKQKQLYVFASHKHHDHFDLCIFDLAKEYPNITYILSKDIKMNDSYLERNNIPLQLKDNIIYVGKNETLQPIPSSNFVPIKIETLTSTDEGVAFIITHQNNVIYHAGDLNFWTWPGEAEEEYHDMEARFVREMEKLEGRSIQIAFVPLDPRQEDRFYWGFDYFMKYSNTLSVFPMHFWNDYTVIPRLKALNCTKNYLDKIMDITQEGQEFVM